MELPGLLGLVVLQGLLVLQVLKEALALLVALGLKDLMDSPGLLALLALLAPKGLKELLASLGPMELLGLLGELERLGLLDQRDHKVSLGLQGPRVPKETLDSPELLACPEQLVPKDLKEPQVSLVLVALQVQWVVRVPQVSKASQGLQDLLAPPGLWDLLETQALQAPQEPLD